MRNPNALVAVVSDSWNIYEAVEKIWGEQLKQEVIDSGATIVIRPDSGEPIEVVSRVAKILGEKFGTTINSKGFKVLKNVRIIQGDGVNRKFDKSDFAEIKIGRFFCIKYCVRNRRKFTAKGQSRHDEICLQMLGDRH